MHLKILILQKYFKIRFTCLRRRKCKKLYLRLQKRSLRFEYFMFFDTSAYIADQIFIRKKIRVWFDGDYTKEDFPYMAVLCHVRKKDTEKFLDALEILKKNIMICGYSQYETEISEFMSNLEELKKGGMHENEGDTVV